MTDERLEYLSPAWLDAASAAVAEVAPVPADVVIGFEISDPERSYELVLGPDRVGYRASGGDAPLVLALPYLLAASIARGEASAQRALLDGEITLSGDAGLLLGHGPLLAGLDDRLAGVRARTSY